ncbi:MAG: phosphatidate cytidylyltransferase [Alphaproteobacteria bacterium]|nr:phosphatidate cytidylyltransferase [Alphaproteobacteria bacterium]
MSAHSEDKSAFGIGLDWRDPLVRRIVSGVLLAALGLFVSAEGGWLLTAWLTLIGARMAFEWARLLTGMSWTLLTLIMGGTVAAAVLVGGWGRYEIAFAIVAAGAALGAVIANRLHADPDGAALGVPYLALPLIAFEWLGGATPWSTATLYWMLLTTWGTDTFAWAGGKLIGGPRLWPEVSPKKTWAGMAGGFLGGLTGGLIVGIAVGVEQPLIVAGLSLVAAAVAQVGDLAESGLKRRFHVKDAGQIIPGHGGVLDRLDSMIAVVVVTAVYTIIVPAGPLGEGWQEWLK